MRGFHSGDKALSVRTETHREQIPVRLKQYAVDFSDNIRSCRRMQAAVESPEKKKAVSI